MYMPLTIGIGMWWAVSDWLSFPELHFPLASTGTPTQTSNQWALTDVRIWCDMATLDAGLVEPVCRPRRIREGLACGNFLICLARPREIPVSKTTLRSCWPEASPVSSQFSAPPTRICPATTICFGESIVFTTRMVEASTTTRGTPSISHYRLGSKSYPEYQISSLSEAFYRLATCSREGHWGRNLVDNDEPVQELQAFIVAIDTEKAATPMGWGSYHLVGFSTTQEGSCFDRVISRTTGPPRLMAPTQTYVHLHYDAIVNIRIDGVGIRISLIRPGRQVKKKCFFS